MKHKCRNCILRYSDCQFGCETLGGSNVCEHKWIYQMSDYKCEKVGYYTNEYYRIDTYYCEKCCEVKEKVNQCESKNIRDGKPYWWK